MNGYILIVNKFDGSGHIVVPFILVLGAHISNVLGSVSQLCALGATGVHTKCVQAVLEKCGDGVQVDYIQNFISMGW